MYIVESDNDPEAPPPERSNPIALDQSDNATVKKSTFGRGRPLKLIRDRQNSSPYQTSPGETNNTGPLSKTTANMTDTEVDRATEDARQANEELFIRDDYNKVFKNLTSFPNTGGENNFENSELDLISNLSSSTELEADIEHEEEKTVRRSKRLTKSIQFFDIITQYVMITGNTVERLNSEATLSQTDMETGSPN